LSADARSARHVWKQNRMPVFAQNAKQCMKKWKILPDGIANRYGS